MLVIPFCTWYDAVYGIPFFTTRQSKYKFIGLIGSQWSTIIINHLYFHIFIFLIRERLVHQTLVISIYKVTLSSLVSNKNGRVN